MNEELDDLRRRIDGIDGELVRLLAKRMGVVREIGGYKKEHGVQVLDEKRWREVLEGNLKRGQELGLSEEFVQRLLEVIHEYSLEIEEE